MLEKSTYSIDLKRKVAVSPGGPIAWGSSSTQQPAIDSLSTSVAKTNATNTQPQGIISWQTPFEINVVVWNTSTPSGQYTVYTMQNDGTNTFTYTASSNAMCIQIRQAGTYYLDNIRMYRTYEDTIFVSGYEVEMAYKYQFNGMEADNEVKGNSYTTEFRQYDPRLGRWLSVDPLAAKYPHASPYNFALNTPIWAMDPDGRVVTFANDESEKAFNEVYRLASDEFKVKLDALKASEVEYNVNVQVSEFTSGNKDPNLMGEVSYEFNKDPNKSKVMVEVADKLNFKLGVLADELTGASQYEEGKMGFALNTENKIDPIGYDMQDEIETKQNSLQVMEAYIAENKGTKLSDDMASFKLFNDKGTPEKYFEESEYGKKYTFTNPDNTNSFAGKSLTFWGQAFNQYAINGFSFKANVDPEKKDEGGAPALSTGGSNRIEKSDVK